MPTLPQRTTGLTSVEPSPVVGLNVLERRVAQPVATIVAVHGGLDRGAFFNRLARRCENFDFVTYDRRGYQGSRGRGPLSLPGHMEDLSLLLAHVAPRGPLMVLGHSYGGIVALATLITEPTRAAMVVAYETPLPWIRPRPRSHHHESDDFAVAVENFFGRVVSPEAWQRLGERDRDQRIADGPALLSDLRSLNGDQLFDLHRLRTPALYLHGDSATSRYYADLGADLTAGAYPLTVDTLTGSSHGAHLSSPDRLATALRAQWDEHVRQTRR